MPIRLAWPCSDPAAIARLAVEHWREVPRKVSRLPATDRADAWRSGDSRRLVARRPGMCLTKYLVMHVNKRSAADYLPESRSLKSLRAAAARCRGCDLYKTATRTVFGEGAAHAAVMFVGEQPGDSEDEQGRPFVGPAGALLRKLMRQAPIDERDVYLTNTVKHFKYIWRGKRRIHSKPKRTEVQACTPWLEAEIARVRPKVVVALGATAAQTLLGSSFKLTQHRGEFVPSNLAPHVMAMFHPSSILRVPDSKTRAEEIALFLAQLKKVANVLRSAAKPGYRGDTKVHSEAHTRHREG